MAATERDAATAAADGRRRTRRSSVRFAPIHQLRAHQYVAEQIRRHIALRLIPPGESLPSERELAAMFGVGRPTVQHALRLLEADRLVDTRRGRHGGTFVVGPSENEVVMDELIARVARNREELHELLVYRRVVEPVVARVAATTRRKHDLRAMRSAAVSAARATVEDESMRCDTEFHLAVARATRNRFFARAIEELRVRLNDAMTLLPESEVWHRRIDDEHRAVIEALEARDERAAEEAMTLHVANAEQGIRAVLAAVGRRRGLDTHEMASLR
jgi:GntR family transcriptional regulator, transcriptional repressor for pyruvate dehydrogenase complex